MRHGPKHVITALTSVAAVAAVGLVPASPSAADPEVEDVQQRVDNLYREAEVASERYNDARIELRSIRKQLKRVEAREQRQQRAVNAIQRGVEDSIVRQYEGEALGGVSNILVSEDPENFVEQLAAMDTYTEVQTSMFKDFSAKEKKLSKRTRATEKKVQRRARVEEQLAADKTEIDEKAAEADALLDRLEAEAEAEAEEAEEAEAAEREQQVSRSQPRSTDVQVSGNAAAAVAYAQAQVGKAYSYGAAGPSAFDCSGLTMMAWQQAGVSLPHSSGAQMGSGTSVSRSELQPGDLVFYYSPVSHVGIYVGNGQLVHAANPSTGVSVTSVDSMPFSGAVRPG